MEGIVPWKAVWRQLQNETLEGNKEEAAFVQKPHPRHLSLLLGLVLSFKNET